MPRYEALFDVGSAVRIQSTGKLQEFRSSWKFHHQLMEEQLAFGDRLATVETIGFYHGGDVLYTLGDIPGMWHESCLTNG